MTVEAPRDNILGVPLAFALPALGLLVIGAVMGIGVLTGAFDTPPQNLPAAEGLEGSSPFDYKGGSQQDGGGDDARTDEEGSED